MEDLSLHILDIAENSINGAAKTIEITINEDREKDLLTIEIKDDGKGMDSKTLESMCDPFFTTRRNQGGTGLGMHILYNLVTQRLGGQMEYTATPGKGVFFLLRIPV